MSILGLLTRITFFGIPALAVCGAVAAAQTKQQVVMLPDPTPRQPDLEQKYNQTPVSGVATDHAALLLNEQRHTLIARASNQLASLAAALNEGLVKHEKGTSLAPEVQVADLIEKLAKNVNAAVKLGSQPTSKERPPKTDARTTGLSPAKNAEVAAPDEQLKQQAARLLVAVQQLQEEASKTDQDTLSLGVLAKSAEVERLAKTLKERMKKSSNG